MTTKIQDVYYVHKDKGLQELGPHDLDKFRVQLLAGNKDFPALKESMLWLLVGLSLWQVMKKAHCLCFKALNYHTFKFKEHKNHTKTL